MKDDHICSPQGTNCERVLASVSLSERKNIFREIICCNEVLKSPVNSVCYAEKLFIDTCGQATKFSTDKTLIFSSMSLDDLQLHMHLPLCYK